MVCGAGHVRDFDMPSDESERERLNPNLCVTVGARPRLNERPEVSFVADARGWLQHIKDEELLGFIKKFICVRNFRLHTARHSRDSETGYSRSHASSLTVRSHAQKSMNGVD